MNRAALIAARAAWRPSTLTMWSAMAFRITGMIDGAIREARRKAAA